MPIGTLMMSWRNCDDINRSNDARGDGAANCRWFGFFRGRHATSNNSSGKEFGIAPASGFEKAFDAAQASAIAADTFGGEQHRLF